MCEASYSGFQTSVQLESIVYTIFVNLVPSILNSCYNIVKLIYQTKGSISLVRGLFEGAYYNTWMSELCMVYSRARTKQGHEAIKEIQY